MCYAYSNAICSSFSNKSEMIKYKKELKKIIKNTNLIDLPFRIYVKLLLFKINVNLGVIILKIKN